MKPAGYETRFCCSCVCIKFDLVQDDDEHDVVLCMMMMMHILPIMWCTIQDDESVFLF